MKLSVILLRQIKNSINSHKSSRNGVNKMTYHKTRATKETSIEATLDFTNQSETSISTGVGFLDHMLTLFSFHSGIALQLKVEGDTYVDDHHTTEDIGIVL